MKPLMASYQRTNFSRFWLFGRMLGAVLLLTATHSSADLLPTPIPNAAAPKIAVSVLPLHSLVVEILRDLGTAQLLLSPAQSPHLSLLTPSQVRALQTADLIIWVGPPLEQPLQKIIAQRRDATRIITLLEHPEITLLPNRRLGALHQPHVSHENAANPITDLHQDLPHADWLHDPHIWLSLANAEAIARIVADELSRLDPLNRHQYEVNLGDFLVRSEQLRQSLRTKLRRAHDFSYVVFHDAYHYFEEEFGLRPVAAMTLNPQRASGAKRIRQIKRLIKTQNVRCVFSEPQFRHGLVHALVTDTEAKVRTLDPLGVALTPGAGAWFALMHGMADSLADCLQ